MVSEDEEFAGKFVWTDEAQFKLNGTVNRHIVLHLTGSSHNHVIPGLLIFVVIGRNVETVCRTCGCWCSARSSLANIFNSSVGFEFVANAGNCPL